MRSQLWVWVHQRRCATCWSSTHKRGLRQSGLPDAVSVGRAEPASRSPGTAPGRAVAPSAVAAPRASAARTEGVFRSSVESGDSRFRQRSTHRRTSPAPRSSDRSRQATHAEATYVTRSRRLWTLGLAGSLTACEGARLVERRDHLDRATGASGDSRECAVGLHDQPAGATHVGAQVVVQHGRDCRCCAAGPGVVGVQVVGDEGGARSSGARRRRRAVAALPPPIGVDRVDRRVVARARRVTASSIAASSAVRVGDLADRRGPGRARASPRGSPISRSSSPRKRAAAQRHQHRAAVSGSTG